MSAESKVIKALERKVQGMRSQTMTFGNDGIELTINVPDSHDVREAFGSMIDTVVEQKDEISNVSDHVTKVAEEGKQARKKIVEVTSDKLQQIVDQQMKLENQLKEAQRNIRNFQYNIQGYLDDVDEPPAIVSKVAMKEIALKIDDDGSVSSAALYTTEDGAAANDSMTLDGKGTRKPKKDLAKFLQYQSAGANGLPLNPQARWRWVLRKVLTMVRRKKMKLGFARTRVDKTQTIQERLNFLDNEMFRVPIELEERLKKYMNEAIGNLGDTMNEFKDRMDGMEQTQKNQYDATISKIDFLEGNMQTVENRLLNMLESLDKKHVKAHEGLVQQMDALRGQLREAVEMDLERLRLNLHDVNDEISAADKLINTALADIRAVAVDPLKVAAINQDGVLRLVLESDAQVQQFRVPISVAGAQIEALTKLLAQLKRDVNIAQSHYSQKLFSEKPVIQTEELQRLEDILKKSSNSEGGLKVLRNNLQTLKNIMFAHDTLLRDAAKEILDATFKSSEAMGNIKETFDKLVSDHSALAGKFEASEKDKARLDSLLRDVRKDCETLEKAVKSLSLAVNPSLNGDVSQLKTQMETLHGVRDEVQALQKRVDEVGVEIANIASAGPPTTHRRRGTVRAPKRRTAKSPKSARADSSRRNSKSKSSARVEGEEGEGEGEDKEAGDRDADEGGDVGDDGQEDDNAERDAEEDEEEEEYLAELEDFDQSIFESLQRIVPGLLDSFPSPFTIEEGDEELEDFDGPGTGRHSQRNSSRRSGRHSRPGSSRPTSGRPGSGRYSSDDNDDAEDDVHNQSNSSNRRRRSTTPGDKDKSARDKDKDGKEKDGDREKSSRAAVALGNASKYRRKKEDKDKDKHKQGDKNKKDKDKDKKDRDSEKDKGQSQGQAQEGDAASKNDDNSVASSTQGSKGRVAAKVSALPLSTANTSKDAVPGAPNYQNSPANGGGSKLRGSFAAYNMRNGNAGAGGAALSRGASLLNGDMSPILQDLSVMRGEVIALQKRLEKMDDERLTKHAVEKITQEILRDTKRREKTGDQKAMLEDVDQSVREIIQELITIKKSQEAATNALKDEFTNTLHGSLLMMMHEIRDNQKEAVLSTKGFCLGCGRVSNVKTSNDGRAQSPVFLPQLNSHIGAGCDIHRGGFKMPVLNQQYSQLLANKASDATSSGGKFLFDDIPLLMRGKVTNNHSSTSNNAFLAPLVTSMNTAPTSNSSSAMNNTGSMDNGNVQGGGSVASSSGLVQIPTSNNNSIVDNSDRSVISLQSPNEKDRRKGKSQTVFEDNEDDNRSPIPIDVNATNSFDGIKKLGKKGPMGLSMSQSLPNNVILHEIRHVPDKQQAEVLRPIFRKGLQGQKSLKAEMSYAPDRFDISAEKKAMTLHPPSSRNNQRGINTLASQTMPNNSIEE